MENTSNQALVGTDAIKAFTEQFGDTKDPVNKIIIEELLRFLLEGDKNAKKFN